MNRPLLKPQQDGPLSMAHNPTRENGCFIQLQDGMLKPNWGEQAGRGQRQPLLLVPCVMSARHCRAGSVAAQKPEGVTTLRSKQGRDCSPTSEPFSSYEVEELR